MLSPIRKLIDLQGLLLYNIEQRGMSNRFPQRTPFGHIMCRIAHVTAC
jgi:hypothetical protein